ncbi:hypothetical protein Phi13:2_gp103 [Cellulophaga phage phi13:2]|uniref:Uncharacterized protein n=1 Tax=Cellulophaga phage phi13:2 TaxID=1328030 RepID=S0A5W8_9CAUD|nr:hypothetical protein Phi13:2_gp103 [Cellulophaga phage phi13:2]AGO49713.1 hypothetical protein Phi13:2_gp103 [Cellulophaga phage phi13:2]
MDNSDSYYNSLNKEQCIHMLNGLKRQIHYKEYELEEIDYKFKRFKDEFRCFIDLEDGNLDKAFNILIQIKKADLIEGAMKLKLEYSKTESRLKYILNE